jgi:hypothetical protein
VAENTWFELFVGSVTIEPEDVEDSSNVSQNGPQQYGYRAGSRSGGSKLRDHQGRAFATALIPAAEWVAPRKATAATSSEIAKHSLALLCRRRGPMRSGSSGGSY